MIALPGFMLRDLRGAGKVRSLWVFCACLMLGIALIAVCGSLLQLVRDGFEQQERNLFGGDLQVSQRQQISESQKNWLAQNAQVSRVLELRTMLGTRSVNQFLQEVLTSVIECRLYGLMQINS